MKRYHTYKDSGFEWIGEVPEGWGVLPIKYVVKIPVTDGPHETPDFLNEGIPFISAEAIKNDKIDFGKKRGFISIAEHKRFSEKYKPQKGDIYMIKSGATTGNVAVVETDDEFNIWSPLAAIRPDLKKTTTKFLFHFMKSINFFESIEIGWSFGTQQNIGMGVIENLPIVAPPIAEQISIATYLDRKTAQIDDLISKKQKLIELLKEERAAIINQAVTKGLNPDAPMKDSGVEWLGEVPSRWEVKRLKWLIKGKLKYGANESTELTDDSFPRYIRITDFNNDGKLRDDTFKSLPFEIAKDYLLHDGDILFARSGATVGKTFLYQNFKGIACYAGYLIKANVNSKLILSNFLYYYTKSATYENWKNSVFIQATIQNIGADKYQMLNVPQPPINEQVSIVENINKKTSKIDQTTSKIEKQIELLKEFRTTLISEVVTGKIDVRDEEIE